MQLLENGFLVVSETVYHVSFQRVVLLLNELKNWIYSLLIAGISW